MDYGVNDQMIRKNARRANQLLENPVSIGICNTLTALSLSVAALTVFGVNRVEAADVPLPIKKIALNSENQVVVFFGKREGEFPTPPHLLETPGPNHRIVLEFSDATVDKINMPAAADLSTKLHKQLAAIKSIRYGTVTTGESPKARVVIEIPEQLKVRPRVVKLEEESVTINLADDIVEQSAALDDQTKGRVQSMEPAANAVVGQAKRKVVAPEAVAETTAADAVVQPATESQVTPVAEVPGDGVAAAGAVVPSSSPVVAEAPVPAAPEPAVAPAAVPAAPAVVSVAKAAVETPALRPEEVVPKRPMTKEAIEEEQRREVAEAEVESEAGLPSTKDPVKDATKPSASKAKPEPLTKRASESLASAGANLKSASANLKKFVRWPHKDDAENDGKDKKKEKVVADKNVDPKPAAAKTPAPSRIVQAGDVDEPVAPLPATTAKPTATVAVTPAAASVESEKTAVAPPDGAEFAAAFTPEPSAPKTVAEASKPSSEAPAPAPGSWDWTAATEKAAATKSSQVTKAEAVVAPVVPVADAQAVTPVASAPEPEARPVKIAQADQMVDDKPKISTPIETTETHTFSEPAQVVSPGASTSMTAGAADVVKARTPEAKKAPTVAETDASDFAEVLKPTRKAPSKPEPEATAAVPQTPLIRDTEMPEAEAPKAPEATETAAVETPQAPAAPAAPPAAPEISADANQQALALYNSAVKAHLSGNLAKAIADYKGALAANPELAEAHSNLGLIYNQQHQYPVAVSEFRKALAINPKDAITYNGIGAALRAQRDLLGAIKNWQTAVSLNPKLATAHYNLGVAYELQRDYDKALASYDEAVKCDYRLGEAYYRMGLILERRHRNDEAKAKFKAALKAGENSEYSADARQQIALLEGKNEKTK